MAPLYACLLVSQPAPPDALVEVARGFSARIEARGARVVLLDAGGLTRLFGDARAIGLALGRSALEHGLAPRVVLASTRVAAWLVAGARPGMAVIPPGEEARVLASLPLDALLALAEPAPPPRGGRVRRGRRRGAPSRHYRLAPGPEVRGPAEAGPHVPAYVGAGFGRPDISRPEQPVLPESLRAALPALLDTLRRWGLRTLGELAALAPSSLTARVGPAGPALWRIARGGDPCPLVPDPEPERFEASCDLDWPVDALEPLAFVLARVLEPVCERLVRADRGAAALALELRLVTRETHARALTLPAPIADPRVLRTLLILDLESHPPGAGVDRVTVRAEPSPGPVVQYSLIEHPRPSPETLATLLARLGALMGAGRSGAPALVDSHAPGAFALERFDPDPASAQRTTPGALGADARSAKTVSAALRRFRHPVVASVAVEQGSPVRVTTGRRGLAGGRVDERAGPWRTSGGWWSSSAWDRDEWDVQLADGVVYRLSRDRASGRWMVEGIVD